MVRVTEDSRTFCLHPEVEKERTTFQGSCISMVVLYTVILHSHLLNFSLYRSLMLKGSKVFKEGRRLRLFKFSVCLPLLWYSLLYWTQGSVQSLSRVWLSSTPWTAACQASLSITNSWTSLKPMPIESVIPSNHLILCCPLFLPPSIFPSIRVFSNESALCIRWPKYWSFSFSISPFNECSGLISFRMDWLDLLVVQGTLKSLFQHHSSKASTLWHSAFFTLQL